MNKNNNTRGSFAVNCKKDAASRMPDLLQWVKSHLVTSGNLADCRGVANPGEPLWSNPCTGRIARGDTSLEGGKTTCWGSVSSEVKFGDGLLASPRMLSTTQSRKKFLQGYFSNPFHVNRNVRNWHHGHEMKSGSCKGRPGSLITAHCKLRTQFLQSEWPHHRT